MAQPETLEDVKKLIKEHDIEFIFASFTEVQGKSSAKLVPASQVDALFSEGVGFAGFAAGHIGQGPQSPDVELIPDPKTFRVVPWQKGLAHVIGYVTGVRAPSVAGHPARREVHPIEAAAQGYVRTLGGEAASIVVHFDDDGKPQDPDKYDTGGRASHAVKALTRQYDLMTTLTKY